MDKHATISQISADGRRLLEVSRGDLDAPVPTCGDWAIRDLVAHMGWVHGLVGEYVTRRAVKPLTREEMPNPPSDDSVTDFAAACLERLVDGLAGVEPDTPVWNWSPRQDAAFYFRRMLHETSVHRWDAENSLGDAAAVDGEQGRDGVDEFFDFVLPNAQARKRRELPRGSIHLHRTDGEGEWLVRGAEDGEIVTRRVHAKGDAAVRGTGGELFLAMWNRLPLSSLQVFGDADAARAWAALAP